MNKGYILTLIYAVFLAFFSVTSKNSLNRGWGKTPGLFTAYTRLLAVFALSLIVLKTGISELGPRWWIPVVITGILNIGIQYSDVKAKSLEDVSLVSPISSTTPAIVIFTSMVILGEYPSKWGWLGIWLIVIGTYILNMQGYVTKQKKGGKSSLADWFAPFLLLAKRRGVQFAFLSALLATLSLNFDAMVYRSMDVALGAVCIFTIAGCGSLCIALLTGELEKKPSESHLRDLALPCVFLVLAILVGNFAFRYTITPYVGTLRRLSIPATIILAYLLAGEKTNFRERMVGGMLMAAGAALLALA